MLRPDQARTPGRVGGSGVGKTEVDREIDLGKSGTHGRIGDIRQDGDGRYCLTMSSREIAKVAAPAVPIPSVVLGTGLAVYESAKRRLSQIEMTPADYMARCRAIADAAGV